MILWASTFMMAVLPDCMAPILDDHRRPDHGHGEEAPITESVSCKHRPCAQVGVGGWAVPVGRGCLGPKHRPGQADDQQVALAGSSGWVSCGTADHRPLGTALPRRRQEHCCNFTVPSKESIEGHDLSLSLCLKRHSAKQALTQASKWVLGETTDLTTS